MTENTDPIGSLRVADSATGQFAEGGLLATATLVPFIPEATATTTPTATPLPPIVLPEAPVPADGQSFLFMPTAPEVVGWAKANDEVSNHFGDYSLFAGIFDGAPHIGAMQFDLSQIPPGSPILYADLTLTGLSSEWLVTNGTWRIQMLTEWMDTDWSKRDYHWLSRADSGTLWLDGEAISSALAEWQNNTFYFSPDALAMLEARLFRGKVSFRVVGPIEGENNLFAWDSGFGARSHGRAPILRIVTGGPAPATPPPSPTPNYVIITLTPDDANALVALAAERLTATAQATPDPNGATPAPTATPTPFPPNWVTPVIVINTPVPENNATAVWQAEVATAQAIVRGTATATPPNVWTATATPLPPPPTPTPLVVAYDLLTPTATPSATPDALPALLRGKIIFYSDRTGSATLMVMEPDGSNVALWTGGDPEWIYAQAKAFEDYSPDRRFRIIVSSEQINNLQLWSLDLQTKSKQQLTHLADVAYDPVWSPTSDVIAFVSPAPGNDELYLINADGSGLTQLSFNQWEWDKHPSWSPDGRQLVFWSNRETQRKQIWIMQADGSNVRNLSNNQFNDWDPIWVK